MAPPTEQHKTRGGARRARQEVGAGPSADRVDSSTQKSRVAKNRRGDPEKRQALSVHALLKKVTGSSAREAKTEVPSLQTDDRAQCAASTSCFGDSAPAELAPDSPGEGLERVSSSAAPRECLAGQVGLFMFDFEECDSKRCTGRRLLHHGKLNLIRADGSVSYSQGARRHLAETESSSEASSEDSSPYEEAEALRGAEEESLRREGGDSLSEGPPDMASSGANSEEEGRHESAPKGRLQRHLPFRSRKFQGILLSPYGDERTPLLSPADASLIAARGLAVVDCSWKKVQEGKKARRIDFVKGFEAHAQLLMQSFRWGSHFFELNRDFLDAYIRAPNGAAMRRLRDEQQRRQAEQLAERERRKREPHSYEETLEQELLLDESSRVVEAAKK